MHNSSRSDEPEQTSPRGGVGAGTEAVAKARKRPRSTGKPASYRARVTNGTALLPTVKGTSVWSRILRDTLDAMIVHLGGEDMVSEPQRLACRRIAVLEVEMVYQEDKIGQIRAAGGEPEPALLDLYSRISNTQRRHLEVLGWTRIPAARRA